MRKPFAIMAAWLLLVSLAWAAGDNCSVPAELVETYGHLDHVRTAVKQGKKLEIIILSAAPSIAGPAASLKSYPSTLEKNLRERLKPAEVNVFAVSVPRKSIGDIAAALPKILAQQKPNLVIWQTGTVEAIRGMDPDVYGEKLEAAVQTIKAAGVDVILMNQQYSPRTDFMFDGAHYTDNMRWVSQIKDVSLFNRYQIMRYWAENGVFDLAAMRNDGVYDKLHRCLGRLLSRFIVRESALTGALER